MSIQVGSDRSGRSLLFLACFLRPHHYSFFSRSVSSDDLAASRKGRFYVFWKVFCPGLVELKMRKGRVKRSMGSSLIC